MTRLSPSSKSSHSSDGDLKNDHQDTVAMVTKRVTDNWGCGKQTSETSNPCKINIIRSIKRIVKKKNFKNFVLCWGIAY